MIEHPSLIHPKPTADFDLDSKLAELRILKEELSGFKTLPLGPIHILDGQYITKLSETITKIAEHYEDQAKHSLIELEETLNSDKTSDILDTLKNILSKLSDLTVNADLEHKVLKDIESELAK